jgi:hypothetical protein
MQFTKSLPKQRNSVISVTNNMGQHYSNVRVPIKNFTTTSVAQRVDKNMSNLGIPEHSQNNHLKAPETLVENKTSTLVNDKVNVALGHIPAYPKTNIVNPLFALQLKPETLVENKTSTLVNDKVNVALGHIPAYPKTNIVNPLFALQLKPETLVENKTSTVVNEKVNVALEHIPAYPKTNIVNPLFALQLKPETLVENKTSTVVNDKVNVALGHIPAYPKTNIVNPLFALQLKPETLVENKTSTLVNDKVNVALGHIPAYPKTNIVNPLFALQLKPDLVENKTNTVVNDKVNVALRHIPAYPKTNIVNSSLEHIPDYSMPNVVNSSSSVLQVKPDDLVENNKTSTVVNDKVNVALEHIPAYPKTNIVNSSSSVLQVKPDLVENNKTSTVVNDKVNVALRHIPVLTLGMGYIKTPQLNSLLKLIQLRKAMIENVYQEEYNNNVHATGLGDFIRGSYFLMEFCNNTHIPYHINIQNHPVSQFLEIGENKQPQLVYKINRFELKNHKPHISENKVITNISNSFIHDNFLRYLSKQHAVDQKIYVYTISYPSTKISEKHKTYMRQILKPSKSLALLVDNTLTDLGLVKKQFTIIHIRYGDNFLIKHNEHIKKSHLKQLQNTLDNLDSSQTYLLISDNTIIKNTLLLKYPFIKTHFNDITHTGAGLHLETHKLQNTMIDFNLFSHATNVIAFSTYTHGTGFSKWAAETYSVPYICKYLN